MRNFDPYDPLRVAVFERLTGTGLEATLAMVSSVWLMVLLAFGLESGVRRSPALDALGLPLSLAITAVLACGLGIYGSALASMMRWRPNAEPTSAGSPIVLSIMALAGLLAAAASAVALGSMSTLLTLAAAAAILVHRVMRRFFPAVAVAGPAIIHALLMVLPNPQFSFGWPILLAVTHLIVCGTLHRATTHGRPRLRPLDGWLICGVWAFLVLLVVIRMRSDAGQWMLTASGSVLWLGPAIATLLFIIAIGWVRYDHWTLQPPPRVARHRLQRLAGMWLFIYAVSWLLSAELWWQAVLPAVLLGVAVALHLLRRFHQPAVVSYGV